MNIEKQIIKNMKINVVFLGTGTSQGVPVICCDCEVCNSTDKKDKRLRTSVYFEITYGNKKTCFVIDTGPDFRQQILREKIKQMDAVLFTHEHKDHVAGLDDIRAFNFKYKKDMEIYCSNGVHNALKNEFHYAFDMNKHKGIPKFKINEIQNRSFILNKINILPIEGLHHKLSVFGYRIGNFTYITDMNFISDIEMNKIIGSKVLVINALRKETHISHFNLKEALDVIKKVNPKQAFLTHIGHQMGLHSEVEKELPNNVKIAYDGLKVFI